MKGTSSISFPPGQINLFQIALRKTVIIKECALPDQRVDSLLQRRGNVRSSTVSAEEATNVDGQLVPGYAMGIVSQVLDRFHLFVSGDLCDSSDGKCVAVRDRNRLELWRDAVVNLASSLLTYRA